MDFLKLSLTPIFILLAHQGILNAEEASVYQAGNIVKIKNNGKDYILIGDSGFSTLTSYQFSLELPQNNKNKEQVNKKEKVALKPTINEMLAKANALYNQKKYKEALTLVESAVGEDPQSAKALAMRGSLKSILGDHEGAIKDWQSALELEPEQEKLKSQLKSQLERP